MERELSTFCNWSHKDKHCHNGKCNRTCGIQGYLSGFSHLSKTQDRAGPPIPSEKQQSQNTDEQAEVTNAVH
jgi:hypothetical protein